MGLFSGFNNNVNKQGNFKLSFADKLGGIGSVLTDLDQGGGNNFARSQSRFDQARQQFAQQQQQQQQAAKIQQLVQSGNFTPQQQAALGVMSPAQQASTLGQQAFAPPPKQAQRRIVTGNDGFQYYADDQTRVLPGVQAKPPATPSPTSAMQEFEFAKSQGFQGNFLDFKKANKGPLVNVNTGNQGANRGNALLTPQEKAASGFDPDAIVAYDKQGVPKIVQESRHVPKTKSRAALTAMHGAIADIGDKVTTAIDQSNKFNTGVGLSKNPFAGGQNLTATLETIQADAAFGALQEMRDNSKTGGALGQVSERELGLLSAAKEAIHRSQSEEQLDANLKKYGEIRERALKNVQLAFEEEYGEPFKPLTPQTDEPKTLVYDPATGEFK